MYRHSRADGNQIQSESLSRDTEIVGDEDSTVVVEEYSPQEEGRVRILVFKVRVGQLFNDQFQGNKQKRTQLRRNSLSKERTKSL